MTANEFRRMALSFPEAKEAFHQGHPDFRVRGTIFATLGYPDKAWGMVKLTPKQQKLLVQSEPGVFVRVKGAWGIHGATSVLLRKARKATLYTALRDAWRNAAPKRLRQSIFASEDPGDLDSSLQSHSN